MSQCGSLCVQSAVERNCFLLFSRRPKRDWVSEEWREKEFTHREHTHTHIGEILEDFFSDSDRTPSLLFLWVCVCFLIPRCTFSHHNVSFILFHRFFIAFCPFIFRLVDHLSLDCYSRTRLPGNVRKKDNECNHYFGPSILVASMNQDHTWVTWVLRLKKVAMISSSSWRMWWSLQYMISHLMQKMTIVILLSSSLTPMHAGKELHNWNCNRLHGSSFKNRGQWKWQSCFRDARRKNFCE